MPLKKLVTLLGIGLLLGMVLGEVYGWVSQFWDPILAIALFHTPLAFSYLLVKDKLPKLAPEKSPFQNPLYSYGLSLGFLLGTIGLALVSRTLGAPARVKPPDLASLALIVIWVPVVEEMVFRGLIGRLLAWQAPGLPGTYLSALFFSWIHCQPTLAKLFEGQWSLAVGPFLLGLITHHLYMARQSLFPAILLHMVANATVFIFGALDPRWLSWLNILYLSRP